MDKTYIIGVDIGTSDTKAIAYTTDGKVLAQCRAGYPTSHPLPDHSEQDPEVVLQAVIHTIGEVVKVAGNVPIAISFSAAMHGLIVVGDKNALLTPLITWADSRSAAYAAELKKTAAGEKIYQRTGTPIHPMSPLCKLLWLKKEQPGIFSQAYKFISIKEYVFHKFFGEYLVDYSIASATGLFDIYTLQWNEEALTMAGIKADRLSRPVSPLQQIKGLKDGYEKRLGIPPDTPFVAGASDGCLANLGTHAMETGDLAVTIGTSGAVRMATNAPVQDPQQRIFQYLLREGKYICGGPVNNGGVILDWYTTQFMKSAAANGHAIDDFVAEAAAVPAGAAGLIFLPYLLGERAPVWDASARGVFFGIDIGHTSAHFMRAILEGICFSLYQIGQSLEETIAPVERIYLSGGFVRSKPWVQILTNVFGKEACITDSHDASSIGAALMGLISMGVLPDEEAAGKLIHTSAVFRPDAEQHAAGQKNFRLFAALYGRLKEMFHESAFISRTAAPYPSD